MFLRNAIVFWDFYPFFTLKDEKRLDMAHIPALDIYVE